MENKRSLLMTLLPCFLIVFGLFTLNLFNGYLAIACIVIAIVMLIERKWPEKWGDESKVL